MEALTNSAVFSRSDYQHKSDEKYLKNVLENDAVDQVMDFLQKNNIEEIYRYVYRASYIRLTRDNAPKIYNMLTEACRMFQPEKIPEVYLVRDYDETVSIRGLVEPFIVISSYYIEKVDDTALFGTIASRVAGICAGHQKPLFFDFVLDIISRYIPKLLTMGLDAAVNDWKRCRFYTYDRAFFLATRDRGLTFRQIFYPILSDDILKRFSLGSEYSEYDSQAEDFFNGNAFKTIHSLTSGDSWLPERYKEISAFTEGWEA